jgi:hypothetical protein
MDKFCIQYAVRRTIEGMLWFSPVLLTMLMLSPQFPSAPTVYVERHERNLLFEFSEARGVFADAIDELRKGFWIEKDRKKAAKKMDQSVDVFLRFLRTLSNERASFDPDALAKLTPAQLATEALSLAQQLQPELRRMSQESRSAVVSVEHWEFAHKLETDLVRLKWMSSRLR